MITPISTNRRPRFSPHAELFGLRHSAGRIGCTVVVAHPNDEVVGAGCLISKISPLAVLHLSDGAPRKLSEGTTAKLGNPREYLSDRQRECVAALELAQVGSDRIIEWRVPQFEVSHELVPLSQRLSELFRQTSPQVVLTHAYEGGHPDHDATAFVVHAAVRLLRRSGLKPPVIYEMAIYPGINGISKVPEFLLNAARESTTLILDEPAKRLKRQMFDCFTSQREVLAKTPLGPEKFREAPNYDFRLPPYFGKLHYEKLDWDMTGAEWRSFARQALKTLFTRTASMPPVIHKSRQAISAS